MEDNAQLQWPTGKLDFSHGTLVMGVLNVTPDSFSDGGSYPSAELAASHAVEMLNCGAAIIDIGPESSRPGSIPIPVHEQIERSVPVIQLLSERTNAVISIDTRSAEVASAALDAGASMINDITGLEDDNMAALAAERKVPVVIMHMLGDPQTMQDNPEYDDITKDVLDFLLERAAKAEKFGLSKEMIFIDPGIGFGKTFEHNIQLLKDMDKFATSGYRLLMGTSRKRFIGILTDKPVPKDRTFGTAATVALSAIAGASIVRVHDVPEMVDVVKVANAIGQA